MKYDVVYKINIRRYGITNIFQTDDVVVKILDDLMGEGKSTWAINFINQNCDRQFLCVLPTLDECDRFKEKINTEIIDPKRWGTKFKHFQYLVKNGKNIVTTHALISKMDIETLELLKSNDYTLIIDECLDVIQKYQVSKSDIKIIFENKLVVLDEFGFLTWNEEKNDYEGKFSDIKRLCSFKSLMGFYNQKSNEMAKIIMWNFPVDFFKCFSESYILTYMWEGSIQRTYFDLHGIKHQKFMLNDMKNLIEFNEQFALKKRLKVVDLIDIYEGKFNKVGSSIGKSKPLSKNWYYNQNKNNKAILDILRNNIENYFRTEAKTESEDNMYTVFESFKSNIRGKGYTRGFVPCNARGTNDYRHKKSLAYVINFFANPDISKFLVSHNIEFDEDKFALSTLLQWIWRSQIRDYKPIKIYIPSERMRMLLRTWITDAKSIKNAA